MKKNNLLIKLLTLLIIIAAVLPVFYMPAYAVEEEYGTQDISDHGISEQGENITSSESEKSYVEEGNNVFDIVPKGYTLTSRGAWIEIPSEKISAAAMNAVAPLAGGVD